MKSLPNIITVFRILLSPVLLLLKPLSSAFLLVYFICGLSDIVDGYIARRFGLASKLGSILDSITDVFLVGIVLIALLPVLVIPTEILVFIAIIALVRAISLTVVYFKYHTFAILHTYANKAIGFLLFCFPFFYNYTGIRILGYGLCVIGMVSAIEELIIHITSPTLQRERISLFKK